MKEVSTVEFVSRFNIAFNVSNMNVHKNTINIIKIIVFLGLLSRLKNGPMMVKTNPNVEDMKNRGNRSRFSQKSDIILAANYID
jgi:hypothetical protein